MSGRQTSYPASYPDSILQWYGDGVRWYTDGVRAFWSAFPAWPSAEVSKHGGCCDPCACDKVHAAVVVRARLGERRVVPVVVTNHWRRKRQVTVGLSDWTSCRGDCGVQIEGRVSPAGELTLDPCERRELIVELTVTSSPDGSDDTEDANGVRFQPDVKACATFCAALTVDGCSTAPVRLAVQVLPRSCDPLTVECDCGCCGGGCAGGCAG